MAGAKSGKAPSGVFAPGGSEVYSDSDRDYFTDPYFHREASVAQSSQQAKDVDRLRQLNPAGNYAKGGQVGKVGSFGMKRSKPDFGAGGPIANRKSWSK